MNPIQHFQRWSLLLLFCVLVCPLVGQSVVVTQDFKKMPMASVMAIYKNEFGHREMRALDDPFPYAVVRVILEGNERSVETAYKKLDLYLGTQRGVEEKNTDTDNEMLFLIPSAAGHVELLCGNGCEKQTIIDLPRLESNAVYVGRVHYMPAEDNMITIFRAPDRQYFKFFVQPAEANVRVQVDGEWQWWPVEEGMASRSLDYGSYHYEVSAERYETQSGAITVSAQSQELEVNLRPTFGWLSLSGNASADDAYAYATNLATSASIRLGRLPMAVREMDEGTYRIDVQKDQYHDFSTTVTITKGDTAVVAPQLQANFGQVTLTAPPATQIYLDNQLLATGYWTGTLEVGDYNIESRKDKHYSAYTQITVQASDIPQRFTLNEALPMSGSLAVEGTPTMSTIYVDGQQVGRSPMIVSPLLVGEHTIRVGKKGYQPKTQTVVIEENKEHMLSYALEQQVTQPAPTTPTTRPTPTMPTTKPTPVVQEPPTKPSRRINTLALLNMGTSFKSQLWGMGLMLGQLYNGYGWYIKGRSNFQKTPQCVAACDEHFAVQLEGQGYVYDYNGDGINDNGTIPFYTENTKASELIVNAGFAMDFLAKREKKNKNNLFGMYLGFGYGRSHYALETTSEMWITYSPWSKQGVSVDLGVMGSVGGFTLAAGVNTINFQYMEAELSIGWTF